MNKVELPGCTPEPLMNYLKALGVFRLVAEDREHGDPAARLSWSAGHAVLRTKFDRDGLEKFFLEDYRPTPIMTPWNSASGFAPTKSGNKSPKDKAARNAVDAITATNNSRFVDYRDAVQCIRLIDRGDENARDWKRAYFARCRAELPDTVIRWLDACFCLSESALPAFPLLGSGGNDGVTDFGSLYMQRLKDIFFDSNFTTSSPSLLRTALFANNTYGDHVGKEAPVALKPDTIGQFNPGGIGGPNGTQGRFEADSKVNPWEFVLMIDGVLLFAGSVSRRLAVRRNSPVFHRRGF